MPLNRTPPHSSDTNHLSTKQPTDGASRQGNIIPAATNKVMILKDETQRQRSFSTSSVNPYETDTTKSTTNDKNWTLVKNSKRPLGSPQNVSKAKQQKLSYWLSNENKFDALSMDDNNKLDSEKTPENEKPPKPPPIFVDRVENIHPLLNMLNEFESNNYELRVIGSNRVKIQPKTPEAFTNIVKLLESKKTEFYTYKPKNERSFKVILRNMHPSVEPEEIKLALKEYGHSVTNVWNMKHSLNKRALPMFVVEMEQNPNNKSIYDIRNLLHSRITFEPPRPKRDLPQCSRCQNYGHTKSGCRRQAKCVKCAGDHLTSECERKTRSKDVKCVLCEGNHPANYKGCTVYKKLQATSFPALRKKIIPFQSVQNDPSCQHVQTDLLQSQPSYAQVVSNEANQNINQNNALISEMREMMKLLREVMSQMTAMTNLLLSLVPKPHAPCP